MPNNHFELVRILEGIDITNDQNHAQALASLETTIAIVYDPTGGSWQRRTSMLGACFSI